MKDLVIVSISRDGKQHLKRGFSRRREKIRLQRAKYIKKWTEYIIVAGV